MRANQTVRYFAAQIKRLPQLSVREKDILSRRIFGETLSKIGERYGLTAERIRQIEESAIRKISMNAFQQKLFKEDE